MCTYAYDHIRPRGLAVLQCPILCQSEHLTLIMMPGNRTTIQINQYREKLVVELYKHFTYQESSREICSLQPGR